MNEPSTRLFGTADQAEMRRWLDRWKRANQAVAEERWDRLVACTDEELNQQTLGLLQLWQPEVGGDNGEALLLQQRAFRLIQAHAQPLLGRSSQERRSSPVRPKT